MRKYKLLQFGKCYVNRTGDVAITLLSGCKKKGYQFAGSCAAPAMLLGKFQLLSRVVENDGNWVEVTPSVFNAASAWHSKGESLPFIFHNLGREKFI